MFGGYCSMSALGLRVGNSYLKIACNGAASFIGEAASIFVANPGMDSASSTVKPCNVLESKVLPQTAIHDFDSHRHHSPTLATNLCTLTTAFSNLVVISKINVKDKFTLLRLETVGDGFVVLWWMGEYRTDVNLVWSALQNSSFELRLVRK